MVLSREYSAATKHLLTEKGLQCVCELCDCGRYHRHDGCTKNIHKMQQVFKRPGMGHITTDYQATYKPHENVQQRHLRRPLPKLRNPNPPPMDFRTEQRMEFITREIPGTKPCKMEESYTMPKDKLEGLTNYNEEFVNRGPATVPKITRPQTVIAKNELKFLSQTTHNATFTHKKPIPQVTYGELPSFTGSILFPDQKACVKTTNQDVYKGKFAKVADLCKPAEDQVTIGVEGEHFHGTTHRETYKTPDMEGRQDARKKKQPQLKTDVRAKFQSETQFKSDFPGYGGKMPELTKPIPPPPETINLAMNNTRDFMTTNNDFYKISWDPKTIGKTQILKPDVGAYSKPQVKMETKTQAMYDFTQKEPVKIPQIRPLTRTEPSKSKFNDETAYKSQFKQYRTVPFQRYGDLHESAFYLKPVTKFYQDGSVTMQDFQGATGGRPSTQHKPIQKLHVNEGDLHCHTTYNSAYVQKPREQCSYLQWVRDRETKKTAAKITLQRTAEPQSIKNALEQTNQDKNAVLVGNK